MIPAICPAEIGEAADSRIRAFAEPRLDEIAAALALADRRLAQEGII